MRTNTELRKLRKKAKMTQEKAANFLGVSRKTLHVYETQPENVKEQMYEYYCEKLRKLTWIDEDHGTLTLEEIKETVINILDKYDVKSCYLFGSYAKGVASDSSDVDLLIDTSLTGLDYYGLVEELRCGLSKSIDLLNLQQLNNNLDLLSEILKDGIKLYG